MKINILAFMFRFGLHFFAIGGAAIAFAALLVGAVIIAISLGNTDALIWMRDHTGGLVLCAMIPCVALAPTFDAWSRRVSRAMASRLLRREA